MSDIRADFSSAVRRLVRRPAVLLVVVCTMALGIAAVTTVFSVADAVLLRPLPLPDSGRIVRLYSTLKGDRVTAPVPSVNYFDLKDVAAQPRPFAAVAPFSSTTVTWRADSGPESVAAVRVGNAYADVTGLHPARGRWFAPGEFVDGADDVAVITDGFWTRAFGQDPAAVGRAMDLDGRPVRIVGILPASAFLFPSAADIWMPLAVSSASYLNNRRSVQLGALARVRPDETVEQAVADLDVLDARLRSAFPDESGRRNLSIRPLAEALASPARSTLWMLMIAVGAVLLIAGANVADLLMSEWASRHHEFAIRGALGAGAGRMMRQLLVETSVLVIAGGAIGVLLVPALTAQLIALSPVALPRVGEIALDGRALLLALAVSAFAGALVALPMMRSARRLSLEQQLREGGKSGSGRRKRRLASALVVVQVAVSVAVLSGGIVLLRTFEAASHSQIGFDASNAFVFNVDPGGPRYETPGAKTRFFDDLGARIKAIPGVSAVGVTQFLPFAPGVWGDDFARVGEADAEPNLPGANIHFISPGLVPALGMKVVAGRAITSLDTAGAPRVGMVNETLAREAFAGRAVGRRIIWQKQEIEIVGVLADKRQSSLFEPPARELSLPWAQQERGAAWVVVRGANAESIMPAVKSALRDIDGTVAMTRAGTMASRVAAVMGPERFRATLAGALGCAAVALSVIGLYGIISHRVARQRREIAIRMALGEPSARVRRVVVVGALRLAGAGVVAGCVVCVWSLRVLQEFMAPGMRAVDPAAMASVSVAMLVVAAAAAWRPALRASRVDPMLSLRQD